MKPNIFILLNKQSGLELLERKAKFEKKLRTDFIFVKTKAKNRQLFTTITTFDSLFLKVSLSVYLLLQRKDYYLRLSENLTCRLNFLSIPVHGIRGIFGSNIMNLSHVSIES